MLHHQSVSIPSEYYFEIKSMLFYVEIKFERGMGKEKHIYCSNATKSNFSKHFRTYISLLSLYSEFFPSLVNSSCPTTISIIYRQDSSKALKHIENSRANWRIQGNVEFKDSLLCLSVYLVFFIIIITTPGIKEKKPYY